jgi:polyhydroxyalkanoate synthesis regulator phasin
MKKKLAYLTLTLVAVGILGFTVANAQADNGGFHSALIQELVERFNLNEQEVQEVFDEFEAENKERMGESREPQEFANLTEEQKATLSEKMEEMKQKVEEIKGLSREERQEAMSQIKEEMEAWAEENGIDVPCFGGIFGRGGSKGQRVEQPIEQ